MVATKSVEQNNKVTVTSDSSLYYSSLAKKYADEAKIAESNITELLEDAVNTAVTSANTATEKANIAGAEVEKAKAEVEKVTETVQNSLTNIESKTLEEINKIKQTGFYMEGDKLYYIDSNGETKEFKSTGSSAKIGDIGFAPYVDETTNERRRLNGQVLIKDQYPAFVSWLTNLQTTTPSLFATEDEWQAIKTASRLGQCGKFVIGDTTIRLPQIININGLVDMSNAGLIKDESLPNITGRTAGNAEDEVSPTPTGAFYSGARTKCNTLYSPQNNLKSQLFSASRVSSTYQDNALVQQEAIQYPYYITVNTGSETTKPTIDNYTVTTAYQYGMSQYYKGIMNSGAWLRSNGQMNPKATYEGLYNWALAQLNAGVEGFKSSTASDITDYDFVVNTTEETFRLPLLNGKETSISNSYQSITVKASGSTYTAPTNGWFTVYNNNGNSGGCWLKNITKHISSLSTPYSGFTDGSTFVPVSAGDEVQLSYTGVFGIKTGYFYFIPAKGEGNLYYYCGNVEENPQVVNVARIEEALVDVNASSRGYLVESYVSNLSGYRLYSDGYCEQWGEYNGSATTGTITLLKEYKDVESYSIMTQVHFDNSGYGYQIGVFNKSINSFKWGSAGSNYKFNWQASGYIR